MDTYTPYYSRGVFIDAGPFVIVRLWKDERLVRDYGILKATKVTDHLPHLPKDAAEVAANWGNTVAVKEVNP